MITIPVYSHLAELSTKEKVEWSLSLLWGGRVCFAYNLGVCSILFD